MCIENLTKPHKTTRTVYAFKVVRVENGTYVSEYKRYQRAQQAGYSNAAQEIAYPIGQDVVSGGPGIYLYASVSGIRLRLAMDPYKKDGRTILRVRIPRGTTIQRGLSFLWGGNERCILTPRCHVLERVA